MRIQTRHNGFSLVELLIAMTLGLILTAGMIAVFAGNKRSSDLNSAMANIQENARFALSQIATDVRMAGFQGCVDMEKGSFNGSVAAAPPLPLADPTAGIRASAITGSVITAPATWTPVVPMFPANAGIFTPPVVNPAITGTHALTVQFGNPRSSGLRSQMQDAAGLPSNAAAVSTELNLGILAGQLVIISDCDQTDMFRVTNATLDPAGGGQLLTHTAANNVNGTLKKAFGAGAGIAGATSSARVMRFESNIYYVADTGLENETGDTITALYKQSLPYNAAANPPVELVQGVENMQVAYGIRINNNLSYLPANHVNFDPSAVESVQVGLLISSWDRIAEADDEKTYMLAGTAIPASDSSVDASTHPKDKRFRLVFNTTIKVRNRRPDADSL